MKKNLLYSVFLMLAICFSMEAQTLEASYSFATDGSLVDDSGNGRALTKVGSALKTFTTDNNGTLTSAFDAQDATGEYLVATGYKGIAGNGARTVAAWIKLRAGSNRRTIASWGINASGKMFNVMIELGKIRVEAGASSLLSASTVPNGSWHHVAVTFDPADNGAKLSSCKMYIDGVLVSEGSNYNGTTVINTDNATNDVRIGEAVYGTTHFYRGEMNDVKIYSNALTGSQVATLAGVAASAPPVAAFSANTTTPSVGEIITFTDASTGSPSSWTWDFGAVDAVGDKTAQNPQVAFQTPGTYTVTLTATNAGGSDVKIKTNYITVIAGSGSGDLQAQYNFDGDLTDASSYGRDLIVTGAFSPAYENDHNANPTSALTASGVYADHLVTGYPGIGAGGARSVTAWFNTTGTSREPIVSWGVNTSGQMFNVMIENGIPRVEGGASSLKSSDTGLNDATWHHIAVTFDPADNNGDGAGALSNCKIYIDGTLSGFGSSYAGTTVLNTDTTTNFLKIGSAVYSTFAFDGALDDVRLYSKALTAAEVTAVMGGGVLAVKDVAFAPNEIKIFPNAVTDILNVQTSDSQTLNISVYNILGRLIKRVSSAKQVDMRNLATGLYIVKIRAGAKVASFKIIKK